MNTIILSMLLSFSMIIPNMSTDNEMGDRIEIRNKTRFQLAVSVNYKDSDGDWVMNHIVIPSGSSRSCCYTNNRIVYYYAVDTHGYGWQIYGSDTYEMNYYNTYVGFRKKSFSSLDNPRISLTE